MGAGLQRNSELRTQGTVCILKCLFVARAYE